MTTTDNTFSSTALQQATAALDGMSLHDLRQFLVTVNGKIKTVELEEQAQARREIEAIAARVGMSPAQLMATVNSKSSTRASSSAPVKYRHPEDASKQWSGRGRQPKWVNDWIEGGKTLSALEIAKS